MATLASAGLAHGDVYVLANPRTMSSLAQGRVSAALERDLKSLIAAPVVVRTDVMSRSGRPVLMSKRTDTRRTLDQLTRFLTDTAAAYLAAGNPPGSLAFLAHRFLPAQVGVLHRSARPESGPSRRDVGIPRQPLLLPARHILCRHRGRLRRQASAVQGRIHRY